MIHRLPAACGAAFVVLTLAGNSLTESAIDPADELTAEGAVADLAAYGGSRAAHLGIALEVIGLVALAVFGVASAVRLSGRTPLVGRLVGVGAGLVVAVKLASGAPLLAGIAHHELVSDDLALGLVAMNDAAFVLCWVPVAVLVGALAAGLRSLEIVGRPTAVVGGLLAALCGAAALLGLADVGSAMPVPFLLSLLWIAVVSARLAIGPVADEAAAPVTLPARTR